MTTTAATRPTPDGVRLTVRDLAALAWLADMKAIYETDIAALVARLPAAPGATPGYRPSPRAVRFLMARWRRAGVAEPRRLVAGRPRIVRLTARGAALVDVAGFRETAEVTAYHQCEVSRLRLWLEARPSPTLGMLTHWESERMFRADLDALGLARRGERGRDRVHVPDGVATYASGDRVAVEVERSVKAPVRLAGILEQLLTDYPVTLYAVASGEVRRAVTNAERAARRSLAQRQVSADRIGAVSIIDLPEEL
jgi:endonuclease YncB( thermonuclease family)